MNVLAVVPARKNSKRLPGKNKLLIGGRTLVEHAVDQAMGSKFIDSIIVSSDDDDILQDTYRKEWVWFERRPDHLCHDDTTTDEVIRFIEKNHMYDVLVLLQPTSPIRYSIDIDRCIKILLEGNLDSVVTCSRYHSYVFVPNGNIFVVRRGKPIYSDNMSVLIQDKKTSVDIDDLFDFRIAEFVYQGGHC